LASGASDCPAAVRGCDRLVYFDGGRVTGEGTYDDLLRRHEAFRGMVSAGIS